MKFALEVGNEMETFKLEYSFNQILGSMVIKVNDKEVKKSTRIFSGPTREVHDLYLGEKQPLSVRIEKQRRLLFGQVNRVFVDGRLVRCFQGI
ncbi:MAG: hypothetical protein H0X66_08830 [Verrucomicrobia bacterium]|nr:hypothetical protein [Verrucomicrobiota bacterium]